MELHKKETATMFNESTEKIMEKLEVQEDRMEEIEVRHMAIVEF